jgi:hypothetical protein
VANPLSQVHGTLSGALAAAQTRCTAPTHPRQRRKLGVWARRRPTTVRDNVPQACNKEAGTYIVPRMSACEVVHSTANGRGYKQLACCVQMEKKRI